MHSRAITCHMCQQKFFPASIKFHAKVCAEKEEHIELPCDYCHRRFSCAVLRAHMSNCRQNRARPRTPVTDQDPGGLRQHSQPMVSRSGGNAATDSTISGVESGIVDSTRQQQTLGAQQELGGERRGAFLGSYGDVASLHLWQGHNNNNNNTTEHGPANGLSRPHSSSGSIANASDERVPCSNCHRKFSPNRVDVHQEICQRINNNTKNEDEDDDDRESRMKKYTDDFQNTRILNYQPLRQRGGPKCHSARVTSLRQERRRVSRYAAGAKDSASEVREMENANAAREGCQFTTAANHPPRLLEFNTSAYQQPDYAQPIRTAFSSSTPREVLYRGGRVILQRSRGDTRASWSLYSSQQRSGDWHVEWQQQQRPRPVSAFADGSWGGRGSVREPRRGSLSCSPVRVGGIVGKSIRMSLSPCRRARDTRKAERRRDNQCTGASRNDDTNSVIHVGGDDTVRNPCGIRKVSSLVGRSRQESGEDGPGEGCKKGSMIHPAEAQVFACIPLATGSLSLSFFSPPCNTGGRNRLR